MRGLRYRSVLMGKLEWERLIYVASSKPQGGHSLLPFLPSVPGDDTQSGAVEVQERPSGRPRQHQNNDDIRAVPTAGGNETVAFVFPFGGKTAV